MLEKALNERVRVFLARVPKITLPSKTMRTPKAPSSAQNKKASARLRRASVSREYTDFCEPVRTIGFELFCTRYESAAAVYAMVSVPCVTTKPSKLL